ncbi:MAG: hypothetical protein GY797_02530 [Deltaproteobacteria bacterium]|nr:hypothetical protein [Deltaproteobacteria bacterium]
MVKKNINITDRQNILLEQEMSNLQISFAELIRRILDTYFYGKSTSQQKHEGSFYPEQPE